MGGMGGFKKLVHNAGNGLVRVGAGIVTGGLSESSLLDSKIQNATNSDWTDRSSGEGQRRRAAQAEEAAWQDANAGGWAPADRATWAAADAPTRANYRINAEFGVGGSPMATERKRQVETAMDRYRQRYLNSAGRQVTDQAQQAQARQAQARAGAGWQADTSLDGRSKQSVAEGTAAALFANEQQAQKGIDAESQAREARRLDLIKRSEAGSGYEDIQAGLAQSDRQTGQALGQSGARLASDLFSGAGDAVYLDQASRRDGKGRGLFGQSDPVGSLFNGA